MTELQTMPLTFRVWDTHMERFIPNTFMYEEGSRIELTIKEISEIITKYDDSYDAGHFIISQDTELKDKNGKRVYTGDIIQIVDNGADGQQYGFNEVGVVVYVDGLIQLANSKWTSLEILEHFDTDALFIVGNIWQNPELLKEN